MMKQLIWLFSLVLVVLGHNIDKQKLTFEQLGNVVRFFNTLPICEHETDVKTKHDDDGRLTLSYKTTLRSNDSDDDLCKCMWRYFNQNCSLTNLDRKCVVRGNQLTLFVTGPPNPNYDPQKPFPEVTAPISALADILQHYPSIELAHVWCTSAHKKLANGMTYMTLECKLTAQSPKPAKVCAGILDTLNQFDWLGTFEHDCSSKDGKLFFEINGK